MTDERQIVDPITEISVLEIYKMRGGVVRYEATAINIAKELLAGLYGQDTVDREGPFSAVEEMDRWVVTGSAKNPEYAARVVLSKSDARLLDIAVWATIPPLE